jgi:Toprim domain/CHC2 zinc finger
MPVLYIDVESGSPVSLHQGGVWAYAACPDTRVWCVCFARDDGEVQSWTPDDPVPGIFATIAANPADWKIIAHGDFDGVIYDQLLVLCHGFPPLPLEVWHCSMTLALVNAHPAELARLCSALGLDYQKDRDGKKLMRELAKPRKNKKGEKGIHWLIDADRLARLIAYCGQDVRCCRAIWTHPRLVHLIPAERQVQIADAVINRRGVHINREFTRCAHDLTVRERTAISNKLSEITGGQLTSVDQVTRMRAYINAHGHTLTSVGRRSITAALAANPDAATRQVLELRRDGARASTHKFKRILAWASADDRMRATTRFHGGAPGRWTGRGAQLQNLKRNDLNVPVSAVDAVLAMDRKALLQYGPPLEVIGSLTKAVLDAAPGHQLRKFDLSAIESRVLAGLASEEWTLDAYREFDRTGNKALEPYRVVARKMLHRSDPQVEITAAERQVGKGGDLAGGFGGSVGAWRRLVPNDERRDDEIYADILAWRSAHPKTVQFWRALARAARLAIQTGGEHAADSIIASFCNETLYLTLPSGRAIVYPYARLIPSKFEDAPPDILFKDNSRGNWIDRRAWFGTLVENVVQGVARDILANVIVRLEARGIPVVHHVHDEVVVELPLDSPLTEQDFLALVLEPPAWARGLPLAGKISSGPSYLSPPEDASVVTADAGTEPFEDDLAEWLPAPDLPKVSVAKLERDDDAKYIAELPSDVAPLWELTTLPLDDQHKTCCPFHEDAEPSCQLYADHYHCYGCNAHGSRLDWLTQVEGLSMSEALCAITDWSGNGHSTPSTERADRIEFALTLWQKAIPIGGTLAERYLRDTRKIDIERLPADIAQSLRFHPHCVFGPEHVPCLLALMRDPLSDTAVGVHRIGLQELNGKVNKIKRMALGSLGAVKFWPANENLAVAEGIETVLAASTRLAYAGAPLVPAWSMISSTRLATLPVLPGVRRLIVLIDHDTNNEGQLAAKRLQQVWAAAGRIVIPLLPEHPGDDFNDVVLRSAP